MPRPTRCRGALLRWLRPVISLGLPLMLWEVAARAGWINDFLFPPPSAVAAAIWVQAGPEGSPPYAIVFHVLRSMMRILAGVGLALVVGSVLGLLIGRSEEHTSELQSLMRTPYAVFCL